MKLKIEINLDNAAFDDLPHHEIYRILQVEGGRIMNYGPPEKGYSNNLYDINGNRVGTSRIVD